MANVKGFTKDDIDTLDAALYLVFSMIRNAHLEGSPLYEDAQAELVRLAALHDKLVDCPTIDGPLPVSRGKIGFLN